MATTSPIKPSDLAAITTGVLACDHLVELLNTRRKMQQFLQWLLVDDESGLLGADFKAAIIQQLIFDAAKKGWFVKTNPASGFLELVEKVALADLAITGAVDGDGIIYNATAGMWILDNTPDDVYLAPTTGGTTIPASTAGGALSVSHGLGAAPKIFKVLLECVTPDAAAYAAGDIVDAASLMSRTTGGETKLAATIWANSTSCGISFFNTAGGSNYRLYHKDGQSYENVTEASWNVKFYAKL